MFVHPSSVDGFNFDGLEIRDFTAGLAIAASVAEILAPPQARHRRARSLRSHKFYWMLEGRLSFEIDGVVAILNVGDLAIVPQGSTFSYESPGVQARMLLVHTPPFAAEDEVFIED